MRRRGSDDVAVETYRGHQIVVNKVTSKFAVMELGEMEPVDTVQKAKNAIDRQIAGLNKGVRRKVLTLHENFNDGPRDILEGELTSWTRSRGYGNRIEGIVVYRKDSRDTLRPEQIYEDTPGNRALLAQVIELDKVAIKAKADAEKIIEKKVQKAAVPAHFAVEE